MNSVYLDNRGTIQSNLIDPNINCYYIYRILKYLSQLHLEDKVVVRKNCTVKTVRDFQSI